ncbi:MAG: hypothetical protein M1133_16685 [Armatimonadetes bacterium]|nr:hypothetical protein [Armatimonadota bacterium]
MNYWLDLFTGTTWEEFRNAGAKVSGFRERMRNSVGQIKPGDILLCYLTGVMRWVGALQVIGLSKDQSPIWGQTDFPARLDVEPLILLDPEHGVPMKELESRVCFYGGPEEWGKFRGFIRMSPNRFRIATDGELVMELLRHAQTAPIERPVDQKKLNRTPMYKAKRRKGKMTLEATVSIPESDEPEQLAQDRYPSQGTGDEAITRTQHTELQFHLLKLGAEMGLNVWVAQNDRGRSWNGQLLGDMPGMVSAVPTQFNEATNRTIKLIDVLWLRGNSIVAAFEVECTTSIYSGLLRMSDLLALQPNLDIKLYLLAPDDRRDKVVQEIRRPTFCLRERPLPEVCGFLPFSSFLQKVEGIRKLGLASSLKPDFLESTAEYFME